MTRKPSTRCLLTRSSRPASNTWTARFCEGPGGEPLSRLRTQWLHERAPSPARRRPFPLRGSFPPLPHGRAGPLFRDRGSVVPLKQTPARPAGCGRICALLSKAKPSCPFILQRWPSKLNVRNSIPIMVAGVAGIPTSRGARHTHPGPRPHGPQAEGESLAALGQCERPVIFRRPWKQSPLPAGKG
jgi:hypothetical protein